MRSSLGALWSWCVAPERRWFLLAVLVGLGLRLVWVLWLGAVDPLESVGDTGRNLAMAQQFSHLETYRLNGLVSAYSPPGYSLLLTPVALLSRATGWFDLPIGAALVNVVAGTATVALGGVLGGWWFGRHARTASAWILAVAAGPVYLTAVALTETVFTALVLAVLVVVSWFLRKPERLTKRVLVGLGALIGLTALVRPPGLALVIVAVIALVVARGSWKAARRPALAVVGTALVVLVPWTVRNVVQVGVWVPVSTNGAAFLCEGHSEHAKAEIEDMTRADYAYCFRHSPFDPDHPDEAAWSRRISRRAMGWAVTHPREEIGLTWDKTWATLSSDHQALSDARDSSRRQVASSSTIDLLEQLAAWWHLGVLALGVLALVVLPQARRAWPLWGTATGSVVVVWAGNALDRFHHTTMALLAVFAAGLVTAGIVAIAHRSRWRSATMAVSQRRDRPRGRGHVDGDGVEGDGSEVGRGDGATGAESTVTIPATAAEGMAAAARPANALSGPYGRPFHPMIAAVAIGAWVCGLGFDVISQVADTAWVYARAAYVLTGFGVVAGVVAALVGLADLTRIPRRTPAFRTGVRHLLCMDGCLVIFAVSFLVRRSSDFAWHDGVAALPMGLSVAGLVLLAFGAYLGTLLAYTFGVRVALDEDRLEGFEPEA